MSGGRMPWLADVARDAGLVVVEIDGWQDRGKPTMEPRGVINHHTGVQSSGDLPALHSLVNGRSDLSGPLCHYGLGRSGTVYVIASGKANHAGDGQWARGGCQQSAHVIGIEAEHTGSSSDPWPDAQLDAYRRLDAAILRKLDRSVEHLCAHREWAQPPGSTKNRKPDPVAIDMDRWRADVALLMEGMDQMDELTLTGQQPGVDDFLANAFAWAREVGVFTEHTDPDGVVTAEKLAAFLDRYHRKVVVPNLRGPQL